MKFESKSKSVCNSKSTINLRYKNLIKYFHIETSPIRQSRNLQFLPVLGSPTKPSSRNVDSFLTLPTGSRQDCGLNFVNDNLESSFNF